MLKKKWKKNPKRKKYRVVANKISDPAHVEEPICAGCFVYRDEAKARLRVCKLWNIRVNWRMEKIASCKKCSKKLK